ncbi:hypothetical protein V496_07801 [Pseudogymnoascus sp. VKM F-4515 (FW-2607)]|nr:hypothetical protein V496_07801 [Pseudogymnoascus sp. VKM F-4515 (FW-2607)]
MTLRTLVTPPRPATGFLLGTESAPCFEATKATWAILNRQMCFMTVPTGRLAAVDRKFPFRRIDPSGPP